jgi:hypothetical protein
MNIVTRQQDSGRWTAVDDDSYDGPGCPIGAGPTEAAAIADLMEQLDELSREVTDALCRDARDHLRRD